MLFPLVPVRLHGWLDELASASYLAAAFVLGFHGLTFWLLIGAAAFHFANTRLTDYPQGQLKLYSLSTHAKLELIEGLIVVSAAVALRSQTFDHRLALAILGCLQLMAALGGDTRLPASRALVRQ